MGCKGCKIHGVVICKILSPLQDIESCAVVSKNVLCKKRKHLVMFMYYSVH